MKVFNLETLRDITEGDAELEQDIYARFQSTVQRCLATSRDVSSASAWETVLHELRGAASAIGAEKLAAWCAEYEKHYAAVEAEKLRFVDALFVLATDTLAAVEAELDCRPFA
jgi:HPt (histidine-containing phosphotransfer) domain-containing protein